MVKFIDNLKQTFRLYRRQSILRVNLMKDDKFFCNFNIKLSHENILASSILKQDLIEEPQIMILNKDGLQFQKDLGMAESEFKDLQDYQIRPSLVVYDDQQKKVLIYNSLLQKHDVNQGIFIGELDQPVYTTQDEITLKAVSVILNDLYKERFLKFLFMVSGTLFLTQATYEPERCTEDVIKSKEQLQQLIKAQ